MATRAQKSSVMPDAATFVADAERITNERDADAVASVFAERARSEVINDGALEVYQGREQIRRAWQAIFAGMDAHRLFVAKKVVAAADGVIVNTWTARLNGRGDSRGIEVWRFDADGLVRDHQLYNYLSVHPSGSLVARLRLALAYPRTALDMLRAQRRFGVWSR